MLFESGDANNFDANGTPYTLYCKELGVPIADQKTEGPSTVITLLGILIDTLKGELTLPEETLVRCISTKERWIS